MRVELALFDGDTLLGRNQIIVRATERTDSLQLYQVHHKLDSEAANITLDGFAPHLDIKTATLHMPIHESNDWETIELGKYTLAFWCRLDA